MGAILFAAFLRLEGDVVADFPMRCQGADVENEAEVVTAASVVGFIYADGGGDRAYPEHERCDHAVLESAEEAGEFMAVGLVF